MPVDDRVRVAPTLDIGRKSPDRGIDGVRGLLLRAEVPDRVLLSVRVLAREEREAAASPLIGGHSQCQLETQWRVVAVV